MTPRFSTVINATGSNGNINNILGIARVHMKQLEVPPEDIMDMTTRVMDAKTYAEALAVVLEWFNVDRGDRNA